MLDGEVLDGEVFDGEVLDGGVLDGGGSAGAAGRVGSGGSVGRPVMAPSSLPLALISVKSTLVYRGWQGMA
jgi:hypothetical protein